MGAWDELDTELTVSNDVSALDDIVNECSGEFAEIFEDTLQTVEQLKVAIDEGSQDGLEIVANRLMSRESRYATEPSHRAENSRASGKLASSITVEGGGYQYVVGTTIDEIYPMAVEYGRGEVHPIPPNTRLRFYGKEGYLIYPLMTSEAPPYPFVQPAFEEIVDLVEGQGLGVFREVCDRIEDVLG